jgi:LysM repeat protein
MRGLIRAAVIIASVAALFILGAPATHAAPPAQGPVIHVVRRGETLAAIAARYGTSVAAIAQANGLRNTNFVWTGQRLRIPGAANPARTTGAPAPSSRSVHVVRRGETLTSVAARYGVSVVALMRANGLRNPNFVYTGQRLIIPARNQPSPPSPLPQDEGGAAASQPSPPSPLPQGEGEAAASQPSLPSPLPQGEGGAAASQPSPPSPLPQGEGGGTSDGKRIEVSLSRQTLSAYENDQLVLSTLVSTGLARTPTPVGRYKIYAKYRTQTMFGPGYYLPNVPHVMYFVGGYALHGTYWHNNFGHPMSRGCVNLSQQDAAWLYTWAGKGTDVIIRR